jgi:ferredoxin
MKVWIDQDLCTGDGLCSEIAPAVFIMQDDGLAYVMESAAHFGEEKIFEPKHGHPGGAKGLARVPSQLEEAVVEAEDECPGECIFIVED